MTQPGAVERRRDPGQVSASSFLTEATKQHGTGVARTSSIFGLTVLAGVVVWWLVTIAPSSVGERPLLDVWLRVAQVLFGAALAVLYLAPIRPHWRRELAVGVLALFLGVVPVLALKTTPYVLGGVAGEQGVYTAAVTKFAAYGGYVDAIYKDLPSFYPPFYFYLLGRLAAVLEVEPYTLLKYGLVLTAFLVPWFAWWLWRRLLDPLSALAVTFTTVVFQQWLDPVQWISLVIFVPWWLYWVEDVREARPAGRGAQVRWFLIGALVGALVAQTYPDWFLLGAIGLLLNLVVGRRLFGRDARTWQRARASITVLAAVALFSIVYWGPYLASMLVAGSWTPVRPTWLSYERLVLPMPFLNVSLNGLLLTLGAIYLAWRVQTDRVARALLALGLSVYVLVVLGYVGFVLDRPLLAFPPVMVVEYLLWVAAALALAWLWQQRPGPSWLSAERAANLKRLLPVFVLILLAIFTEDLIDDLLEENELETTQETTYPQALLASLDTATAGQWRDRVVLSASPELLYYRPVYGFLPWTARYSHPAGQFERRRTFLEKLAATNSPALFAAAWMNNRYSKIDYALLAAQPGAVAFRFWLDTPLNEPEEQTIAFPARLFDPAYFQAQPAGDYTLFTTDSAADPLTAPHVTPLDSLPLPSLALFYALSTTFAGDIGPAVAPETARVEKRLLEADLSALPPDLLLDLRAVEGPVAAKAGLDLLESIQPLNVTLNDETARPKLRVIGYTLVTTTPGQVELAIYFEALDRMERDYTIWLHATSGDTQHNLDHLPVLPTSAWLPGKLQRDVSLLPLAPGDYHFVFGLWKSDDGSRLTQPSGSGDIDLGVHQIR
ncbi:MAG TPA: arabinofuranosyltransferase [Ardenticatenaceae bacterium]|nr:arabinofuranosyltransferase [Ardenticatenaceae bacterium]